MPPCQPWAIFLISIINKTAYIKPCCRSMIKHRIRTIFWPRKEKMMSKATFLRLCYSVISFLMLIHTSLPTLIDLRWLPLIWISMPWAILEFDSGRLKVWIILLFWGNVTKESHIWCIRMHEGNSLKSKMAVSHLHIWSIRWNVKSDIWMVSLMNTTIIEVIWVKKLTNNARFCISPWQLCQIQDTCL